MKNNNLALQDATIAIQKEGRLTEGSLEWLNENAGTDFMITDKPFEDNPFREMTDRATGITIVGYSNGDTLKAVATGQTDLAIPGSDKYYEVVSGDGPNIAGLEIYRTLGFAPCRLVFAQREGREGAPKSLATSYVRQANQYLTKKTQPNVAVSYFAGGIEMNARRGGYDALVDIVDTGKSLAINGFEEVDVIRDCGALLVGRSTSSTVDPEIYDILTRGSTSIANLEMRRLMERKRRPTSSLASQIVVDQSGNRGRKKLGEEMAELIAALAIGDRTAIVGELADVDFALKANAAQAGIPWELVTRELMCRYLGSAYQLQDIRSLR